MSPIRRLRFLFHAVRAVRSPSELGRFVGLSDSLATREALAPVAERLARHPSIATAMRTRRRLGPVDLKTLAALPPDTLGRALIEHLETNGLTFAPCPSLPSSDEVTFVRAHLREVHDVWHTLLGFGTDVAGELGLQAFSAAQVGARFSLALLAGGLVNALFFSPQDTQPRLQAIAEGYQMGHAAKPLFGIHWPDHWHRPLEALRAELGITCAYLRPGMSTPRARRSFSIASNRAE